MALSTAGLKDSLGLECFVASVTDEGKALGSTALRILMIQHQISPQFSLRTGAGPSGESWLVHGGVILARDPRDGAQIGAGIWGASVPVGSLQAGLSLEALASRRTTQRQAVFTLGYHF
jgi:hypothetical protein